MEFSLYWRNVAQFIYTTSLKNKKHSSRYSVYDWHDNNPSIFERKIVLKIDPMDKDNSMIFWNFVSGRESDTQRKQRTIIEALIGVLKEL